jgi:hypothetical protein
MVNLAVGTKRNRIAFLAVILLIASTAATISYNKAFASAKGSDIKGNIVNSKYLTITDHRFRNGQFSDTITGTVANNSTQEISFATVYASLYDSDNRLITIESGSVSVPQLPPGDNSPFDVSIIGVKGIDHYTLSPAGTPR